nr:UDP-N-acetylmuramate--L-alanine ligase [uncultured Acetatifactor sp.]
MYTIDFSHPSSLYFVGIGGISMSGMALLLQDAGFQVCGSDRAPSATTEMLEAQGVTVFYGQRAENMTEAGRIDCVVFTAAIHPDNPEYKEAHARLLPCLTRGQLLGQIMKHYQTPIAVSGTHGKTTATSMVGEILLGAGLDPTLSIGGVLKDIGGNMRIGHSGYFVAEACEYTNSFLDFFPKVGIILNIGEDHLDFFKDLEDIRHSFRRFAQLLPQDGCLVVNGDIERLEEITEGLRCRVVTFGAGEPNDYFATDIRYDGFGNPRFILHCPGGAKRPVTLSVPGEHNVHNALAAFAVAECLDIDGSLAAGALQGYKGTDRRFEHKGTIGGVTVIDDYAHHPTEIEATLKAAANYPHRKLWCVFQPHTYTRTKAYLKEFARSLCLADEVVLADIYAARETDTLGVHSQDLQREIQALGHVCHYFPSFDEIENFLLENCIKDDLLITMGAGDVVKIGESLLGS